MHDSGDLLWLNRHPGGLCLFLESEEHVVADLAEVAYERYTVVHPTDGVITAADWYFTPCKENGE